MNKYKSVSYYFANNLSKKKKKKQDIKICSIKIAYIENYFQRAWNIYKEKEQHVLLYSYCKNIIPQETLKVLSKDYTDKEYSLRDIKMDHILKNIEKQSKH